MKTYCEYGLRKRIVLDAHSKGKTIQQLVKEGHSYAACMAAARREGIRLASETKRTPYGNVKNAVIEADRLGKSIQQLVREGYDYKTCHAAASRIGIKLISEKVRKGYGSVKSVVLEAKEKGLSLNEASESSGIDIKSIRDASRKHKIELNKNGKK